MNRFALALYARLLEPLLLGLLLVLSIFGSWKGTAVRDDYAWFIGAIVAIYAFLVQGRIAELRSDVRDLRLRVRKLEEP